MLQLQLLFPLLTVAVNNAIAHSVTVVTAVALAFLAAVVSILIAVVAVVPIVTDVVTAVAPFVVVLNKELVRKGNLIFFTKCPTKRHQ